MTTNESLALRANQAAAEISVYNNISFSCSHVRVSFIASLSFKYSDKFIQFIVSYLRNHVNCLLA